MLSVEKYVIPIFEQNEKGRPDVVGTGILVRLGPSNFLVSAAHVAERQGIYLPARRTLEPIVGVATVTAIPRSGKRKDDRNDLAFMELSSQTSDEIPQQWDFLTPDMIDPNDRPTGAALYEFSGYPTSQAHTDFSNKMIRVKPYSVTAPVVSQSRVAELGLHPLSHIVVYFDRKEAWTPEGQKQLAPEVYGMSGGAVWRVWRSYGVAQDGPVKRLVGIAIENLAREKVLIGVRVSGVLEAIRRKRPELGRFIPKPHSIDFGMTFNSCMS